MDRLDNTGLSPGVKVKTFAGKIRSKTLDEENYTVDVVMSDETLDRYYEVIFADGWDLKDYKKHPVLLSSHRYAGLLNQIGQALSVRIEGTELVANLQYFVGEGNAEADWAWTLAKKGIAAFSVGFSPLKSVRKDEDGYPAALEKWRGAGGKSLQSKEPRLFYLKQTLLENSQVLVPANPNGLLKGLEDEDTVIRGLATQIQQGVDTGDFEVMGEEEFTVTSTFDTLEQLIKAARYAPIVDVGVVKGNSDITLSAVKVDENGKTVVPYKEYNLLPEDTLWSSAEARVRLAKFAGYDGSDKDTIDWKVYATGFGWFNADSVSNFGSYKLPHHDVDAAKLKTHWRGVATAMATVLGARGGVDISETDRRGVYDHLKKHYQDFGKEAPDFKQYNSIDEVESGCKDITTVILLIQVLGLEESMVASVVSTEIAELKESLRSTLAGINVLLKEVDINLNIIVEGMLEGEEGEKKSNVKDVVEIILTEKVRALTEKIK